MSPRSNMCSLVGSVLASALIACSGSGEPGDEDIASYMASGTVLDFETDQPLEAAATVSTDGLTPAPTISVTGPSFTIEDIPPHSVFHVLAGSPPTYRSTYNVAITVTERDVDGIEIFAVREEFLAGLADAFDVTTSGGTSVLLGRLVDEQGAPVAGVPGTAFELPDSIVGPYFLDADRLPDPGLSESSASGWVAFFEVSPGLVSVSAAEGSGYRLSMADSPVAATAVTLADIVVRDGEVPELPTGVSFSEDVAPIFAMRGCVSCHDGGGIGKDLGDLHLNGADNKMYREVTEEISPTHGVARVDLEEPENSLLLTMPSREDPPDAHPNITFAAKDDPDYLIILGWITEGALHN